MKDAISENRSAFDPEVEIDGVRFRLWKDGDVEIDLDQGGSWCGHFFSPADAVKIRDWLIEVLK